MKNITSYAVRNLMAKRLDISENWIIGWSTLGMGNPKGLVMEYGLILHIIW
jgi:hypothetical protein